MRIRTIVSTAPARRTDPLASHLAAESIKMTVGSQQYKLLAAFGEQPRRYMTDDEAWHCAGRFQSKCYWHRVSDLLKGGLLEQDDEHHFNYNTGKWVRACRIIQRGQRKLEELQ